VDEIKKIRYRWPRSGITMDDQAIARHAIDDIPVLLNRIDELERWVTQLLREKGVEVLN
jgi:hypothetical protein